MEVRGLKRKTKSPAGVCVVTGNIPSVLQCVNHVKWVWTSQAPEVSVLQRNPLESSVSMCRDNKRIGVSRVGTNTRSREPRPWYRKLSIEKILQDSPQRKMKFQQNNKLF